MQESILPFFPQPVLSGAGRSTEPLLKPLLHFRTAELRAEQVFCSQLLSGEIMSISDLVILAFAALGAVSLFIFIYCICADRHDGGSGKDQH